jgi:hypothetical protein
MTPSQSRPPVRVASRPRWLASASPCPRPAVWCPNRLVSAPTGTVATRLDLLTAAPLACVTPRRNQEPCAT